MVRLAILLLGILATIVPVIAEEPPTVQPVPAPPPPAARRAVYGTVRGTVVSSIGKPLQGVMVQLIARDQTGMLRVTGTDDKGQYSFAELPAGTFDVEVSAGFGGRSRKERVTVKPPFRNIVDFRIAAAGDATLMTGVGDLFAKRPAPEGMAGGTAPEGPGAGAATAASTTGMASSPPPVPVRGTLVDARRQPATEAVVTLIAHTGTGIFQTMSGVEGTFLIEAIPPGRYRLRVTSPGHVILDVASVEVVPGSGMALSLSLVDYPLAAGDRRAEVPPREVPRALPPAP